MPDPVVIGSPGWEALARRRRMSLGALVILPAAAAGWAFTQSLPPSLPWVPLVGLGLLFSTLFAWISWGAWTAIAGYLVLRQSHHRTSPAPVATADEASPDDRGRTVIAFPICDEDVDRVFAGVRATYQSVAATGRLERFEFYILSDSHDPDTWIAEEASWARLCRGVDGFGRIYYRRRPGPTGGKAGNLAEFCRGWGRRYQYMVVLDADSIMAGSTIVQLVALMDGHREVGIIQTLPVPVNKASLFARARQFSSRLCGPVCAAGLHYWQLGDGVYWGHNAIVRVEPFMASCGLPRLPGTPPLGGQIMSHDFVEAALIRRAGWTVWLAYDLEGSYEEVPTTIPDHLKRDRRWCRGNLQHARLLWLPGLSVGHRLHLLFGISAYLMAPLWMMFLAAEMVIAAAGPHLRSGSVAVTGASLHADWAIRLFGATFAMLLLPKILALALVLGDSAAVRRFGGRVGCVLSVVLELFISAVVAPTVMVSHTWFVISILAGARVGWASQRRRDYALTWPDAWRGQWGVTAFGIVWLVVAARMQFPVMVEWLAPMLSGLLLAVPVSVYSSSAGVGALAREWGLFLTPEERKPPLVLRQLRHALESRPPQRTNPELSWGNTFARTVVDPYVNAHHIWQMMFRAEDRAPSAGGSLVERALQTDPIALDPEEQAAFLDDPDSLARLHLAVWSAPEAIARRWWAHALRPDQHIS
ncbi:MAG TPA: glucans biosynthesis glucosyltransferase MdoH [bacterium]|nr:glucans biosynthesis glucosyltransferase MdoH [bacterium]